MANGKCRSIHWRLQYDELDCYRPNYSTTHKAPPLCACAVNVFPSMCRQITCSDAVVDRHVSPVAKAPCEICLVLDTRLLLYLVFFLLATRLPFSHFLYRRMSENDDIDVDSDVGGLVSLSKWLVKKHNIPASLRYLIELAG